MAYREVSVVEIKEILRLWVRGMGFRPVAKATGSDRKTIRRYIELAQEQGLSKEGGTEQLTDELIATIVSKIQPGRTGARGDAWRCCERHREQIKSWLDEDLTLTKVLELLGRKGAVELPYRTLHRFATEELGFGRKRTTLRVDDCEPGQELQLDFGFMGLIDEASSGRQRKVWALIFTAVFSRHQFVFFTHRQRLEDIIEGFERAWTFFGGIFKVVIPDNMKAIVASADPVSPKFTEGFLDYMQARDFTADPARVRHARDKPRVERAVPYVRESCFKGEGFRSIEGANEHGVHWCMTTAGLRDHGTIHQQPLRLFEEKEQAALDPAPTDRYDVPVFDDVKVHNDQHFVIGRALYSMPVSYVGQKVHVRMDRKLVKAYHRRALVKIHGRQPPGGRSSAPEDFAEHKAIYARRDTGELQRRADGAGPSVAEYARRLLEQPEPWRRMRAVYRLLGLAHRFGDQVVDQACDRALALDVVDVTRIERIVKNALETEPTEPSPSGGGAQVIELRFARPREHFAVERCALGEQGGDHELS